jgi:crotonobetainyl-CoA:carnitine CoA-transferase CaiB-like acyl-CoA transferase
MENISPLPPLAGVRVLDCGTAGVGPWAATLLGYLGANVVKVEPPGGEMAQQMYPRRQGVGTAYTAFNTDQKIVTLDLKNSDDFIQFEELVRNSDVLVENFRSGVAQRLGIDYASVNALNSQLIYGSSSAWGNDGPMRDQAAVDPHLQAFSGFAALNGALGGPPEMLRYMHIDPNGSVFLAVAVVLGLLQRARTGSGTHLETSHFAMALAMQGSRLAECLESGVALPRLGSACQASAPNQCFLTADGYYLAVSAENEMQWRQLCNAIQRTELLEDTRFASNAMRCENRQALAETLQVEFSRYPQRWWISRLERANVPHSRLLDYDDLRFHPQITDNEYLADIVTPADKFALGGLPWHFDRTPARMTTQHDLVGMTAGPPETAEDSKQVPPLAELTVIDASEGHAGPLLALFMAEAGAQVTKAETPEGDCSRQLWPASGAASSALFAALNRNKSGLLVDVNEIVSRQRFDTLLVNTDVLIYDRNIGLGDTLDLAADSMRQRYPHMLLIELSAYGSRGPLARHAGTELSVQAMTGYLRNLGHSDDAPVRVGADIAGSGCAAFALLGTLAALYERTHSGKGQRVQCSMLGALMSMRSLRWLSMQQPDSWQGTDCNATTDRPWLGYEAADGYVWPSLRTVRSDDGLQQLLKQLAVPPDMSDVNGDRELLKETIGLGYLGRSWQARWNKVFLKFPKARILEIFRGVRGIAVEFCELHELIDHPQTTALGLLARHQGQTYLRAPWQAPWDLPELKSAPAHPGSDYPDHGKP